MVTSATPGLPMITVAAGALILRMRAMLTLTLIGSPSAAAAGMTSGAAITRKAATAMERSIGMVTHPVLNSERSVAGIGEYLANAAASSTPSMSVGVAGKQQRPGLQLHPLC